METVLKDIRYGIRGMAKNLSFTAIAVLTLALGIGATTAIFSVVNPVLLRPLPYAESERLLVPWAVGMKPNITPLPPIRISLTGKPKQRLSNMSPLTGQRARC